MSLARWQRTIVDDAGNVLPAAQVTVRSETTGAPLAQLFSDRAGLVSIGNPFAADSEGFAAFHVAGGAYQISAASGAFSRTWRYVGIGLAQELDAVSLGIKYLFSTSTTDSDPGDGFVRFNNAALASVTTVYIDLLNADGVDFTAFLDSLDDGGSASNRGTITFDQGDGTYFAATVTGSITTASGYRKILVTPIATGGTFAAGRVTGVSFSRAGADAVTTQSMVHRNIADITAGDTIVLTDNSKEVTIASGTGTLAFTAAATLGSGFYATIRNIGTGDVTLNPNGAELIDGLATWILYPGGAILVQCDGSAFRSVLLSPMRKQFDSSGTFTKPGVGTWVEIEGWGGGGSGARGAGVGVNVGGGGGGGYNMRRLPLSSLGATETVTIGAGGAARSTNQDGATGGNTTFGAHLSAFGGGGGDNGGNGGGGGGGPRTAGTIPSGAGGGAPGLPFFESDGSPMGQGGDDDEGSPGFVHGGGGGDGATGSDNDGGTSVYGGGGGGGCSDTVACLGGASSFGGAGGNAAVNGANAQAGTQPGGGGGASEGVATGISGAGGAGRVIVYIF